MTDRYPGFLFSGAPVNSWEHRYNTFNSGSSRSNRLKASKGYWGSMSDGGGMNMGGMNMGGMNMGGMNMGGMNMGGMNMGGAGSSRDNSRTNLIVNYLPQGMSEKELYEMFGSIGQIESCRVMRDFKTGYCFGFGFVNYMREEDATNAINSFNGYAVQNKRLKVSYARPSGDDIKETNLYVTNLPRGITESQLDTIFGKYGRIVQKHILRDKSNGNPRGVAFVRYDKREEAQEAISALNNIIPEGGTELLSVKVAEEHGKQKAAYYAGWSAGLHQNREDEFPPFGFGGGPGFAGDGICPPFPQDSPPMIHPVGKIPRGNFARSQDRSPRPFMFNERTNVAYPGYIMSGKGKGRAGRGMPWSGHGPNYMDERFKGGGNRFRNNVPSAYW